jgi:hypothetical protein
MEAPQNPAGAFVPEANYPPQRREEFITIIQRAPAALRQAVAGLSEAQLDTKYRNWTIRQIVHHLADSHMNSYIRFKWTLTEERPTIKAYHEDRWAELEDERTGQAELSLALLEALHARWVQLLRLMTDEQYARSFVHPETGAVVSLADALCSYAWHCRHHTGQILWLREKHGW